MVVRNYSVKRVFVNREDELTKLSNSLSDVSMSRGQIVLILGERGIGKTRLMKEFKRITEEKIENDNENAQFLSGRCKRTEGRDPYQPFIDAFNYNLEMESTLDYPDSNIISHDEGYEREEGEKSEGSDLFNENENMKNDNGLELSKTSQSINAKPLGLIPFVGPADNKDTVSDNEPEPLVEVKPLFEPLPMGLIPAAFRTTEVGDITKGRTYLFETMTRELLNLAAKTPLILFIDDLQWASLASLGYLEFLRDQIINNPVLLIFSVCSDDLTEDTEKNQKINELMEKFKNFEYFTTLNLERFDLDTVATMIKKIFSREDVPDTFIKQIYQKTGGNPLFIEDVIRALIEEDVIDVSSFVWQTRLDVSQVRIPETTREMLIARLGKLDKEILRILGYAAVIGREFSFDLLSKLTEISEIKLLDAIDNLLDEKLIYEDQVSNLDQFKFDNPLIQDISYMELSRSRRRFLHTRIGTILEQENKNNIGKVVFDLADHFSKGRNFEKALKYLILAGDRATQIYAIDDARRYYLTALETLNKFDYTLQIRQNEIELLSNLGNTCKMLGDWDQALEYYRNVPKLAENLQNKINDEIKAKKKSKEIIPSNWIPLKLADTYWNLAELMRFKSDWEHAEKNYKKSLMISQEVDDYHGIALAECGRGYIFWRKGEFPKALEHYDICIDFATKINDLPVIAVSYIDIGNIYNYTSEWEKAIAYYKESIEHLEKIGWLHEMGRAFNGLGEVYLKQEHWSESIENFEKCEEISKKIGDSYQRGWALFNAAECYAKMNQLDKALDDCKLAEEILTRLDDRVGLGQVYKNFGIIYNFEKNWVMSEQYFNKSIEFLKKLNVPYEFGIVYLEFGKMLLNKGEKDEARKCLEYSLKVFKGINANVQIKQLEDILKSKR